MINILLVDDDEAAHFYHREMIREANIKVNSVTSAMTVDEAVSHLNVVIGKELWPDYIFVDLNMPCKSGYDFIAEFKKLEGVVATPQIYFVSSTKNPMDIQKAASIDILSGFETKFLQAEFFKKTCSNSKQLD